MISVPMLLALAALTAAPGVDVEAIAPAARRAEVVLAPRAGPTAAVVVTFHVGSVDDGDDSGLTRLSQHVLLAANGRLRAEGLAERLFRAGASLRMETSLRECRFVLTAPAAEFDGLVEAVLPALLSGSFLESRLAHARRKTALDAPPRSLVDGLEPSLARAIVDDWRYDNPPLGDPQELDDLTADMISAHLARFFRPANASIAFAGAFDLARMRRAALASSGGERARRALPPVHSDVRFEFPSVTSLNLRLHRVALADPSSLAAAHLLLVAIEEQLELRFRRSGLAYSPGVALFRTPWLDAVLLYVESAEISATGADRELAALTSALSDVAATKAGIARWRSAALGRLARVEGDPARLARMLSEDASLRAGGLGAFRERIAQLSAEELAATGRSWFEGPKAITIIAGPGVQRAR